MDLRDICYELLAKYAAEKAWIAECFCNDEKEHAARAIEDQKEVLSYKERIERVAKGIEEEFVGLTD